MRYYTLYNAAGVGEFYTRSKQGKIMLFPSREDAEMYRDAYYGRAGAAVHKVVELEVERVEEKKQDYQLMTAIHWWETRDQR